MYSFFSFFINMAAVLDIKRQGWLCNDGGVSLSLTCICQAVIGRGVGQHLPAPISAVLDAAVCTLYCKTSLNHYLWNNTDVIDSVSVPNKKNTFPLTVLVVKRS